MKTEEIVNIGKSLSHPNRVEILKLLSNEEICACQLLEKLDITQPTLSHHMKQLNKSKLIKTTKKGTWSYYKLNNEQIEEFKKFLDDHQKSLKKCDC